MSANETTARRDDLPDVASADPGVSIARTPGAHSAEVHDTDGFTQVEEFGAGLQDAEDAEDAADPAHSAGGADDIDDADGPDAGAADQDELLAAEAAFIAHPPIPAPVSASTPSRGFRYAQVPGRETPTEPPPMPMPATLERQLPTARHTADLPVIEAPLAQTPVAESPVADAPPAVPVLPEAMPVAPSVATPIVVPQDLRELPEIEGEIEPDADEPREDLLNTVERLRMNVATLSLGLDLDDSAAARRERESLLSQLDDYLLPRLRRRDAPLLAVIGGSTGAGKSTLTNSLVRREVSRSGVLRPTTRSPVLIHHPFDSGAFMTQRILPRLERITSEGAEPLQPIDPHAPRITGLRLVPHDGLTPGMAIIDAPDIDSLVETNRDLAVQLLGAADLWIFVTTAARYADAMPWEMLKQAADRGVAVAVVLDRVPPEALQDLRVHLATRLRDRGLGGAPLFTIPETEVGADGFLPERIVAPLLTWLRRVAGDERSRTVIAERTLKGIVGSIPARAELLSAAAAAQNLAWVALSEDVDAVFAQVRADLLAGLAGGSLMSGDVQARWQESIVDGALVRRMDSAGNTFGDRMAAVVRREGVPVRPLDVSVTLAAVAAVQAAVRVAVDSTTARWRLRPGGQALVETRDAQLRNPGLTVQIENLIEDWRESLVHTAEELVMLPTGEHAVDLGAAVDVLFVSAIDQATDAEGGNPSVVAARRILATLVDEEQVQAIVSAARADLLARGGSVIDNERLRLERLLDAGGGDGRRAESLLVSAAAVQTAHQAGVR